MKLYFFLLILFLLISSIEAKSDKTILQKRNKEVEAIENSKKVLSINQIKISSLVYDTMQKINLLKKIKTLDEIRNEVNDKTVIVDMEERIRVKISFKKTITKMEFEDEILFLENQGCVIKNTYWPDFDIDWRPEVICFAPIHELERISSQSFISTIQPIPGCVIKSGAKLTEGDYQLKADLARNTPENLTGYGVRVGVISDGITSSSSSIASGDLPSDIINVVNEGGDEGTAMMEIIYDLAPQCSFSFASHGETSNDMNDRIAQLIGVDGNYCKIIVDDVGWPGDPYFKDGFLAQEIAKKILNSNIIYISAAGNNAECTYTATYKEHDDGINQWHDFYHQNTDNTENMILVENDQKVEVIMQWADSWDDPQADFDIYLFEVGQSTSLGSGGKDVQGSSTNNPPREILTFTNTSGSSRNYVIQVKKKQLSSNTSEPKLKLLALNRTPQKPQIQLQFTHQYNQQVLNQIFGHAAAENVISVAAYDALAEDKVETFSSRGPTYLDNTIDAVVERETPVITATDNVKITGAGGFGYEDDNGDKRFPGTSAAAPHIAGIAALYKQKYPTANFSSFIDDLKDTGTDIDSGQGGVYNNKSGYGKADAYETLGGGPLSIIVDQQNSAGTSIDSVGHWVSSWLEYAAGSTFSWEEGEIHKLQADTNVISNEKFHDWKGDVYINHSDFTVKSEETHITAKFDGSNTATVATKLLSGGIGGDIEFKDPWLRDFDEQPYGVRNRGMDAAPFKSMGASYTLTLDSDYQGVFTDHLVEPGKPYYSIRAKKNQNFSMHGINTTWYFSGWVTNGSNLTDPDNIVGDYYQSPVVFTSDNSVVEAKYKGHYMSANPQATGHNNGRRVAKDDDGNLHMVYEDNNEIWYCWSNNNGTSWSKDEKVYSDLVNGYFAINPSITYYNNRIYVTWAVYYNDPAYNIFMIYYDEQSVSGEAWSGNAVNLLDTYGSFGDLLDLSVLKPRPSIAVMKNACTNEDVTVIAYDYYAGNSYFTDIVHSELSWSNYPCIIIGKSPSLSSDPHHSINYKVVGITYEDENRIMFQTFEFLANGDEEYSTPVTVSQPFENFDSFENPNIVYFNSYGHIVWDGLNTTSNLQEIFYRQYNPYSGNSTESAVIPPYQNQAGNGTNNISSSDFDVLNPSISIEYNAEESRTYAVIFYNKDNKIYSQKYGDGFKHSRVVGYGDGAYPSVVPFGLEGCLWTTKESAPFILDSDYYLPDQGFPLKDHGNWGSIEFVIASDENNGQDGKIIIGLYDATYGSDTLNFNQTLRTDSCSVNGNYMVLNMDLKVTYININNVPPGEELMFNLNYIDQADTIALTNLTFGELPSNAGGSGERFFKVTTVVNLGNRNGYFSFNFGERQPSILRKYRTLENSSAQKGIAITQIIPQEYKLHQNYPNPFNPVTHITVDIPEACEMNLSVYNIKGQKVRELLTGSHNAGIYEVVFDGSGLASGLYFYRLQVGSFVQTKRMLLVK